MHHDENHNGPSRRASVLIVTAGIALLAVACGGGGSSTGSSQAAASANYQKLLAYAQCMRSHGVPKFPDPNSNGQFVIGNGSVNLQSPQAQAAQKVCRHLSPIQPPSQAQQAQALSQLLKYAQCMRSHGVPKYPDPNSKGGTHISKNSGINPQSPQFQSAQRACRSLAPGQSTGGAP
jgi:hypothetical protein